MIITFNEAQTLGIWSRICELTGISEWAVNEGRLDANAPINVELPTELEYKNG